MKTVNTVTRNSESKEFGFSRQKKIKFILKYVSTKTISFWYEVKAPRLRLFTYEVVYSVCRAVGSPPPRLAWLRLNRVTTTFGTFNIRPGTTDAACVSPAFERPDLDHFINLLGQQRSAGRSVLFLDVGADVGTYAVSVAGRLRNLGGISVLAFEPGQSSYDLLGENIVVNDLAGVIQPRRLGLGDGSVKTATFELDPREPGGRSIKLSSAPGGESEAVQMSTIDEQVDPETIADVVALKLDVEGSEIAVLSGATATLNAAQDALLLVEDFIDDSVVSYLMTNGWTFLDKLTPYNSFWRYSRSS